MAVYESECFKRKKRSAENIFSELKNIEDFGLWAARFRYYAHVAKDLPLIKRWINRCFDFKIGLPIALFSALVFLTVRLLHFDWEITFLLLGSFYFGCAFLFGLIAIVLSVLCANVGVGSVLALKTPLANKEFGDPIYGKLGSAALLLSAFSAINLGIGIPLLVSDSYWALVTTLLVACFIIGIFLISLIGLHIGMKESKDRKLSELKNKIYTEADKSKLRRLLNNYDDVEAMRVWPINTRIISKLATYVILPVIMNFRFVIWSLIIETFQRLLH